MFIKINGEALEAEEVKFEKHKIYLPAGRCVPNEDGFT